MSWRGWLTLHVLTYLFWVGLGLLWMREVRTALGYGRELAAWHAEYSAMQEEWRPVWQETRRAQQQAEALAQERRKWTRPRWGAK